MAVATALLAASLAASVSAQEQIQKVQVFQLRFRSAREAILLVEPLLSPDGSYTVQPTLNTLTIRDAAPVLDQVEKTIATWDVAPPNYVVRVRVLIGTTSPPTVDRPAPLISGIGQDLLKVFHFTRYREVDTLQVTAADGSAVEAAVGGRYHIRFVVRGVPTDEARVQLVGLVFSRRSQEGGKEDGDVLRPILRTNVSLGVGQTSILGAARSEDADQGLVLVLWAQREENP